MSSKKNKLILDDNYISSVIKFIDSTTGKASLKLDKLLLGLENAIETGVKSGETSEVLHAYIARAKELSGVIEQLGEEYTKELVNFRRIVDKIDGDLY